MPTDSYSLDEAVADRWLVPPKGMSTGTKFLRRGIRYVDLSEEEKDEWDAIDWGEDAPTPTQIDAEEINRILFNKDTVDKVLATVMESGYKVAGGDRLGKTIIFAISRRARGVHPGALRRAVVRIRWHVRACHHARHQVRPDSHRRLLAGRQGPAHRDLRGYARHWH